MSQVLSHFGLSKAATWIIFATLTAFLVLAATPVALAHQAAPCNDANGDGSPSGREFAEHHITELAKSGMLGKDGHIPGEHMGFSACLNVH